MTLALLRSGVPWEALASMAADEARELVVVADALSDVAKQRAKEDTWFREQAGGFTLGG